jgi:hypothetical protein
MSGMVVNDGFDRGVRRVGGVKDFEELDEFAAAVAFLDQCMDVTGEQINAGHQCQSAVSLIFVMPHYGRAGTRKGRAIRRGGTDRPDSWFLVVGHDGEAPVTTTVLALAIGASRLPTQHRHLPLDTEDFGHLGLELGIALLQAVAYFVRLDLVLSHDFADPSFGQLPEAEMPGRGCVLTGMRGEQSSRPQLVRITQLFGLLARQRHQPGFRLCRNDRVASGARPIIQRLDHPGSAARLRHRVTVCCVTPSSAPPRTPTAPPNKPG